MSDREHFSESEEATDDRPIRQGDIFEWLAKVEDPWRMLGLVVTADCDIAHAKHRGILSYVPILPLADFLRFFCLPKLLRRLTAALAEELSSSVRHLQSANVPEFPEPLSNDAILTWVTEREATEIADDLRVPDGGSRAAFTDLAETYKCVAQALTTEAFEDQLNALFLLRRRKGATADNALQTIVNDMRGAVEAPPGDCFFIGCLDPPRRTGYVAYLRLVREIQDRQIAVRQSDLDRESPALARRIARLRSPYIFRLTQQLADVFLAIGLPAEYELQRRSLVDSFALLASASLKFGREGENS